MLKTISSITNALGALNYKGTWNAATNTPTLADGTGAKGDYYVVSTAGTQTFGGVQLFFGLGDWIAYNGAVWQRVEGGSDGNFANVTLTSTDVGATASPLLELYRDSASPAANDTLGEIEFNGEDSAGNKQAYALFHGSILSPTSGSEQGQLHFETATAGALTEKMIIGTTNLVINEIGAVFNVRIEGDGDANLFYTDATNDRIGVGTISPSVKFEVSGAAKVSGTFSGGTSGTGYSFSGSAPAGSLTLDTSGNLLVGTTTAFSTGFTAAVDGRIATTITNAALPNIQYWNQATSGDNKFAEFYTEGSGGTLRGSITYNRAGGLTSYNVSSDYRSKDLFGEFTGSGAIIDSLKVYDGLMKGATVRRPMFVAHEAQAIVPYAVTGTKDAVNDKGDPVYQSMDHQILIPLLVAEVQSLRDRIAVLETK